MKFYKKIALGIILPISLSLNAQESIEDSEISFFDTTNSTEEVIGVVDAGGDPTEDDLAPINDYAPLLVLGGIAVYAFSRKKFQLK